MGTAGHPGERTSRFAPDEEKEAVFGKGEAGLESSDAGIDPYLVRTPVENDGGDCPGVSAWLSRPPEYQIR